MAELIRISELCSYIPGPTKIGVVQLGGGEVCLIDSGNDKSAGRAVRRLLEEQGWSLRAIFNTHSHADHIGGNQYLQAQTGCRIYAPAAECPFVRHPFYEPAFLYGGFPPKALQNKFLMAPASEAEPLTAAALPPGFEIIPLPGHSFEMVGFRTPDDVVFVADSIMSRSTLEKYRISYTCDIAAHIRTLEMLPTLRAALFVPSHAEVTADIAPAASYNLEQMQHTAQLILSLCRTPISTGELLKQLADALEITLSFEQHALIGSTLRSYLTWLQETARITPTIADNRLLWHTLGCRM